MSAARAPLMSPNLAAAILAAICLASLAKVALANQQVQLSSLVPANNKPQLLGQPEDGLVARMAPRDEAFVVYAPAADRFRRQVTELAPGQQPPLQPASGGAMNFLTTLGQQVQQAQVLSSLLNSATGGQNPQAAAQSPSSASFPGLDLLQQGQQSSANGANALMGQIGGLFKSAQERSSNAMQQAQQVGQQSMQQANQAAQSASTGLQAALTDFASGLQKIATNNPSLVPDVKNLYSSVSSKLSSSSSSSPQQGAEKFADSVAKEIANPGSQG